MSNTITLKTIQIFHVIIIAYFVFAPYIRWEVDVPLSQVAPKKYSSLYGKLTLMDGFYIISVVSLITHWMLNSDMCFLTELERIVRGNDTSRNSFLKRLIRPLYIISDKNIKDLSYFVLSFNIAYLLFSRR